MHGATIKINHLTFGGVVSCCLFAIRFLRKYLEDFSFFTFMYAPTAPNQRHTPQPFLIRQ
jgi:hypothetical protein